MSSRKRRMMATATLAVALLASASLPVAAAGPERSAIPFDPFTLEDVCAFPVLVEEITSKAIAKTFSDADGNVTRIISTGQVFLRLTNETTGASIVVGSSGPGTRTPTAGGEHWVQRGVGLYWALPGEPSGPDLWLTVGRTELDFDMDFALVSVQRSHRDRLLCPELAN